MSIWQIVATGVTAVGATFYISMKTGDWLGKKLCDYLDRENQE